MCSNTYRKSWMTCLTSAPGVHKARFIWCFLLATSTFLKNLTSIIIPWWLIFSIFFWKLTWLRTNFRAFFCRCWKDSLSFTSLCFLFFGSGTVVAKSWTLFHSPIARKCHLFWVWKSGKLIADIVLACLWEKLDNHSWPSKLSRLLNGSF